MSQAEVLALIAIELIRNPDDHNRPIDLQHVEYLATAISRHGLQHPIQVIANSEGGYDVIAGLHRLEACRKLEMEEIECRVLPADTEPATLLEISISENESRKPETLSETMGRIDHIMRVRKCEIEEAAGQANVHKSKRSKFKLISGLCEDAKALIHEHPDKIGVSIAYDVARFAPSDEKEVEALQGILNGSLKRDMLKAWLTEPAEPKEKQISLKLTVEGIAVKLGIPESTDWNGIEAFTNALKSLLLAEKKFKRLVSELPNHIGEVASC